MDKFKERATLKDIAERVGITVNSVSRALKGSRNISKATQLRVKQVAKELGYIPDNRARSLRSGHSNVVAIVFDYFINPYYSIMTYLIDEMLSKEKYRSMIFIDINKETLLSREVAKEIISHGVSGVITFLEPKKEVVNLFKNYNIPLVLIGRNGKKLNVDSVYSDDFKGGYIAAKELIRSGCKKIGYLGTKGSVDCNIQRMNGYKKALEEANIDIDENLIQLTDYAEKGNDLMKTIIDKKVEFDGIFCFSDLIAFEAISYLMEIGYNIPNNVSVVGFDNIQSELRVPFRLTTVETNKSKIVEEVIRIIFHKVKNKDEMDKVFNIMIDVDLCLGSTTK